MGKDRQALEQAVKDVCGCNGNTRYCLLREVILHSGTSSDTLEQARCIDDFEWEIGERIGAKTGWEGMSEDKRKEIAHKIWIDIGYAKKFREIYEDGLGHRKLYSLIVNTPLKEEDLMRYYQEVLEKERQIILEREERERQPTPAQP